jgi:hypothetical protein
LDLAYRNGSLSYLEYKAKQKEIFKGRSIESWTAYYDSCIEYYQHELRRLHASKPKKRISVKLLFTIGLLVLCLGFIGLTEFMGYTGYTIFEESPVENVSESINISETPESIAGSTATESAADIEESLSTLSAGDPISVSLVPNGSITYAELSHPNFSLSIVYSKSGAYNITSVSRNVENSDRVLGATHNKTSEIYNGDVVDFRTKNSQGNFMDILFLNRIMFLYTLNGNVRNISSVTADTSTCSIVTNTSTFASVECTMTNSDVTLTITYIAAQDNTHPIVFYAVENRASSSITFIEYYNYLDCDVNNKSNYEGKDDLIALIKHTGSADQTEQVSKEGYVVCDTKGLSPEAEISKCSVADNDSFYLMQQIGSGTPSPKAEMYCGFSTKFTPASQIKLLAAFANPSTDTDGLREVVPNTVVMSSNSPMDKSDIVIVGNIEGATLQPGEMFRKYYGLVGTPSTSLFSSAVDENVSGVPLDIINNRIYVKALNNSIVSNVGAYVPFNISIQLANTIANNFTNINYNCTILDRNNQTIASDNHSVNLASKDPITNIYCGGIYNLNNSLTPGIYTINMPFTVESVTESATSNFTILSDYNGSFTSNIDNSMYECNDNLLININTTNFGNTNFTGNLTINLFENGLFKENIVNSNLQLIKNLGNITNINYLVDECSSSGNYSIRINLTTSDENDGLINFSQEHSYYLDNIYPSITFIEGYDTGSRIFKKFNVEINVTEDYAISSCILELKKGSSTYYNMYRNGSVCSLDINLTSNGNYEYRIFVNDTFGHTNVTNFIEIEKSTALGLTKFNGGNTTDMDRGVRNAHSHRNFTLETDHGLIRWLNNVDLVDQDFESNVEIVDKSVTVISSSLDSSINSSAEVYLYNMSSIVDPRILTNSTGEWKVCNKCHLINFNKNAGILIFNTTSFSSYIGQEGTNLTIFDDSDSEGGNITRYAGQEIRFFANYTNSSYAPIFNEAGYCNISFNNTGEWSTPEQAQYNATSKLYEYTKQFNNKGIYWFNFTCVSLSSANLSLIDNITLPNWVPTTPEMMTIFNASSTTDRTPIFRWNNSVENDLDTVTYEFILDNNPDFSSPITNITINETESNTSYTPFEDLAVDTTYYYKVRAFDGTNYSEWNTTQFEILSLVEISLPIASIDFGTTYANETHNTTESGQSHFVISNDGNVLTKIFINATNIFQEGYADVPGRFEFMIMFNETNAYNDSTITGWNNITGPEILSIRELKYENNTNTANRANLHLLIRAPSDQTPGNLSSTIFIRAAAE